MDNKFTSQEDLFKKLLPALRTKKHEIARSTKIKISEKDIWEYNKQNIWRKSHGLTLASMVDDILNTFDQDYIDYKENKEENGDN